MLLHEVDLGATAIGTGLYEEPEFDALASVGRSLHQCQSPNEMRIVPDGGAGDREVLHRTQRMDAPVCVSGDLPS